MIGSSSYYNVVRAIDSFCLGAAMQTSPMLDDYGGMDVPDDTIINKKSQGRPPSEAQGMLFSIDEDTKPEKRTEAQSENFVKLDHYTYDEYMKIFCGNKDAAGYWWEKDMRSLEMEQKYGHIFKPKK